MTQKELDAAMSTPPLEDSSALYQRELEHVNDFWGSTVDYVIGGGELARDDITRRVLAARRVSQVAVSRKLPPRR